MSAARLTTTLVHAEYSLKSGRQRMKKTNL